METLDDMSSAYLERFDFSSSCETCDIIRSSLHQTDPTRPGLQDLGLLDDLLDVQCPGHDPLIRQFYQFCGDPNASRKSMPAAINELHPQEPGHLYLESEDGWIRLSTIERFWTICLAKRAEAPGHDGLARVLDPDWVDLVGAKRCKDLCLSSHREACSDPLRVGNTSPAWLIDTETGALVPGDGVSGFVALSYRWGLGKYLTTTVDNLQQLQRPGSLRTPEVYAALAPIIQRAMHLVQTMGERYLWADTLCIVSGDKELKEKELDKMGGIYASAVFTIIDADGDAETGLAGLRGASPSRALQQHLIPFYGGETLVVTDAHVQLGTTYDGRGWTFQEFMLSKRRLIFRKRKLFWMCSCEQVAEEFDWREDLSGTLYSDDDPMDAVLAGFQDFDYLSSVVVKYSRREFTYEQDALPGIRGLLTLLSRTFEGGFLYGIPEMIFGQALAWTPGDGTMHARTASDRHGRGRDNTDHGLPSWSWIGWQGRAFLPSHLGHEVVTNNRRVETITPLVEWYTSMSPRGPWRHIRSKRLESQEQHKSRELTCIAGWTRYKYDPREHQRLSLPTEGCGEFIYTHKAIPDRYFWFPIPLMDITSSTPSHNPEQTPYISCETKRSFLFAYRERSYSRKRYATLMDMDGEKCGRLQVNSSHRYDELPDALTDTRLLPLVELAVICRRRVVDLNRKANEILGDEVDSSSDDEMDEDGYSDADGDIASGPTERHEYVVLWIEWEEDVAYRRGIGWVSQECWERLFLTKIHLVLG